MQKVVFTYECGCADWMLIISQKYTTVNNLIFYRYFWTFFPPFLPKNEYSDIIYSPSCLLKPIIFQWNTKRVLMNVQVAFFHTIKVNIDHFTEITRFNGLCAKRLPGNANCVYKIVLKTGYSPVVMSKCQRLYFTHSILYLHSKKVIHYIELSQN